MINKGAKTMEKFLHKQWQDLTNEEQVYFLENSTITVSKLKTDDDTLMSALVSNDKNVLLACNVDENNEVHIKDTARFRSKDELNNIE
jgi:hypothetical protein